MEQWRVIMRGPNELMIETNHINTSSQSACSGPPLSQVYRIHVYWVYWVYWVMKCKKQRWTTLRVSKLRLLLKCLLRNNMASWIPYWMGKDLAFHTVFSQKTGLKEEELQWFSNQWQNLSIYSPENSLELGLTTCLFSRKVPRCPKSDQLRKSCDAGGAMFHSQSSWHLLTYWQLARWRTLSFWNRHGMQKGTSVERWLAVSAASGTGPTCIWDSRCSRWDPPCWLSRWKVLWSLALALMCYATCDQITTIIIWFLKYPKVKGPGYFSLGDLWSNGAPRLRTPTFLHEWLWLPSGVGRLHLNDIKALYGDMRLLMWSLVPVILPVWTASGILMSEPLDLPFVLLAKRFQNLIQSDTYKKYIQKQRNCFILFLGRNTNVIVTWAATCPCIQLWT